MLHSYVLGRGRKGRRHTVKVSFNMTIILVCGLISIVMGNKQGMTETAGRQTDNNNGTDFVERMNYGITFSPIAGMYVPTEATYNLMLVLDISMFGAASNMSWKTCVPNTNGKCRGDDLCEIMTPGIASMNRTTEQNHTCSILGNFVGQLQSTRREVANSLMQRLKTYMKLTEELVQIDKSDRSKRDGFQQYYYDNGSHINDMDNDYESHDKDAQRVELKIDIMNDLTNTCKTMTRLADRMTCMMYSMDIMNVMVKHNGIDKSNEDSSVRQHKKRSTNDNSEIDPNISKFIQDIALNYNETKEKVNNLNKLMGDMSVPHLSSKGNPVDRRKRGMFNFGGKILGSLFGVVTQEEVTDIKHAISVLDKNQYKVVQRLQTFEKRVVAVANVTNAHLHKMTQLMNEIDGKFINLFSSLYLDLLSSARFAAFASSMLLTLMQDIAKVEKEIDQFLVGLRSLQRRELSIELVTEDMLASALADLQEHIIDEYSTFRIAEMEPVYYYKYSEPVYSWENDTLIVYLTIPLRSTNTAFKLYEVSTFSVPVDRNDSLETRPIINREIFGISYDGINFLEMKKEDLQACTLAKTIRCELAIVIRDVFHKSCLLALFENDKEGIHNLCSYRMEAAKATLGLQPLAPGRVLVSNAASVSIQCPGRPAIVRKGCNKCIWVQSCSCGLIASDINSKAITLTPSLEGCQGDKLVQRVEYPINYPALSRLLDNEQLKKISHEHYMTSEEDIPDMKLNIHPLARNLSLHENYHFGMDIDQAVNKLKQDSVLSPFTMERYPMQENSHTWTYYLATSMSISAVLSLIILVVYKGHKNRWGNKLCNKCNEKQEPEEDTPDFQMSFLNSEEQPVPRFGGKLRGLVAEILREFASETDETGVLPAGMADGPSSGAASKPTLYPTLPQKLS